MGNNTSNTTQYIIGSTNTDTRQSQTSTVHIPLDVSTMVNPGKFEGDESELLILYTYIAELNKNNTNTGVIDEGLSFDAFCDFYVDTQLMGMIQESKEDGTFNDEIKELETQLIERGIFSAIFTGISNLMSGKVSISQNFLKMINAATSRITATSKATLGEGITNRLLAGMRAATPSIKKFMDEVYSGLVDDGNDDSQNDAVAPAGTDISTALSNSGLLGAGGGGWLPPPKNDNGNNRNLSYYRQRFINRGDNTENFRKAYSAYQDILTGNNKVNLNKTQNIHGAECYECPAAALLSEQHTVSLKTTANIINTALPPMIMSEYIKATSKANLAGVFGSPPSIANTPSDDQISSIIKLMPLEFQPSAAEHVRQDGARYGLTVRDLQDPNSQASPDPDIIQLLVDNTPVNTSAGSTISSIRRAKQAYHDRFPEGVHTIEALIASPSDVSLRDVPVPNSALVPWDNVVDAVKNNCGGGTWITRKPVPEQWPLNPPLQPTDPGYYLGNPWHAVGINAVNMASGLTIFFEKPFTGEEFKSLIPPYPIYQPACIFGCNFKIRPIYSMYNIIFQLNLSYWECDDSKGAAIPGLFFINGPITDADKNPLERRFIPAARKGNSMLYTITIATENTANAVLNNLFGADGIFTFGVAWDLSKGKPTDKTAFSISIIDGTASLSRAGTSQNLGYWVVNGKPISDTFISQIFTVTMLDEITSHPADVSYFWSTQIVPQFRPFLGSLIKLVRDKSNRLAVTGMQYQLQELAFDAKDFATMDQVFEWLEASIAEFGSWMLYRGDSPFVKIRTDQIGKMAWCVICMMRAFCAETIFLEPNSQTVTSAMRNLSVLFKDDNSAPQISDATRSKYNLLADKTDTINAARSNQKLGRSNGSLALREVILTMNSC